MISFVIFNQQRQIDKTRMSVRVGARNFSKLVKLTSLFNTCTYDADEFIKKQTSTQTRAFDRYTEIPHFL